MSLRRQTQREARTQPRMQQAAAAAASARLRALALADVPAPPAPTPGGGEAAEAAAEAEAEAQNSALLAFAEVLRACDALELPGPETDAVCGGVDATTAGAPACRRFLGSEYPQLRSAAAAGDVGLARAWLAGAAAWGPGGQ